MKKILLMVVLFAIITVAKAQVPQQLNYQGIARQASGEPISYQNITVRVSFIDSAAGGQVVYRETRRVMTNYVGLFNIVIGSTGASNITGTVSDVNWSTGKKYIKLEMDPRGLNNFSLAGITQLQSVAYALSATPSGNAGGDLSGSYPAPAIANSAITTNKIADGNITLAKLDSSISKPLASVISSYANKLNVSDTAAMLGSRLKISDTMAMLSPYYRSAMAATDLASKEDAANKSTDGTLASNSDIKFPTEKATRTYVDAAATGNSFALAAEVTRATNAESVLTLTLQLKQPIAQMLMQPSQPI